MTVMPFSQGGVFGPADIKAMSIALDEVCSKLALGAGQDEREFLAKRVIAIACRGERDSAALRDGVLQEAAVSAWRGLGPSGIIGAGLCPSAAPPPIVATKQSRSRAVDSASGRPFSIRDNKTGLRIIGLSVAIVALIAVGVSCACAFFFAENCGSAMSYYGCDAR